MKSNNSLNESSNPSSTATEPKPKESFALLLAKGKHLQGMRKQLVASMKLDEERENAVEQ